MSLKCGQLPPKGPAFEKKPRNHGLKYSYVNTVTDTGKSASKIGKVDSDRLVAKRREELFKRVKVSTLAVHLEELRSEEPQVVPMDEERPFFGMEAEAETQKNTIKIDTTMDLLVLDVRSSSDFDICHVRNARCYPKELISHDKISTELYLFKKQTDKKIVVYDVDDKATAKTATLMMEKGFTNVYALSGGFEQCAIEMPSILDGIVPEVEFPVEWTPSVAGQGMNGSSSRPGTGYSVSSNVSRFTQMSGPTTRRR